MCKIEVITLFLVLVLNMTRTVLRFERDLLKILLILFQWVTLALVFFIVHYMKKETIRECVYYQKPKESSL